MAFTSIVSTTVTGETVNGIQNVVNNGTVTYTTLNSGGRQFVSFGGRTISNIINSWGRQNILSGGLANSTTINVYGTQTISSGGIANNSLINSGGLQNIGGVANFTTINNGEQWVGYGGNASSTIIGNYGHQHVFKGGIVNITTINSDGSQIVSSGGSVNSTVINSGGSQVLSGGSASNTIIKNSGMQVVSSGGMASDTIINSGGYQYVAGVANQSQVSSGGMLTIGSGGSTIGFSIASGGILGWDFNAVFSGTSNGVAITGSSGKSSYNLYLSNDTYQYVSSGYTASSTTINNRGWQGVSSGGTAINTIINSGGYQYVGGFASKSQVGSGGMLMLKSGGTVIDFSIASGGILGWDFNAVISGTSNGVAITSSSGKASYNLFLNRTTQYASSGYIANSTNIDYYGCQCLSYGGVANSTTVTSHGVQVISFGGIANNTTVYCSGSQYVSSGGVANFTAINSGGTQIVDSGGVASNTIVSSGAVMHVSSGGIVSGTLTIAGGNVSLEDASVSGLTAVSYILTKAIPDYAQVYVNDGTLGAATTTYSLNLDNAATGSYILADGVLSMGLADKAFSVTNNSQTVDLTVGSNCTFSNGDKLSLKLFGGKLTAVISGPPEITVTATDITAGGHGNDGTFRISRTGGDIADALTVYFTVGGTATAHTYSLNNGASELTNSVVIAAGQSYADITLEVADNAVFSNNQTAIMSLSANTAYTLGLSASANVNILDNVAPTMPTGLTGVVTGKNVAFDWGDCSDSGSGLKNYLLEYALNGKFTKAVQRSINVSNTNVSGLADGIYSWRVQAVDNNDNTSNWVTGSNFTIDSVAPAVPSGLSRVITGCNVAFDWANTTDATSGVKQYEIQVDNNKDFISPEFSYKVTASEATATGLSVGMYYWQVRAQDNSGNWSAWNRYSSFVVTPADTAGNSLNTANDINSLDNWVGLGDTADYYKLTMTNAGTLTLSLNGLSGDANLFLLNTSGIILKASTNLGIASEAINNVALLAGTYYIKVFPADNGLGTVNTYYTLTHKEKYYPTDIAGNTWQMATDISNLDNRVGLGDTVDFYKLTMTNAGTLTLVLAGLSGNADLSLLNSAGTVLKTSSNTGTTPEAINNVQLLAGTYYVKVAAGFEVNDANYMLSNTIKYCPADKSANDYKTAQDISNLDNWVGFGDTADFYKLTMTNAGTLTLVLAGLSGNADLSLLNSTGTVLKTSSNTGTTPETINNVALLAGTYYVKVAAGFWVNDASYTLTNTEKYCPTDTAANTWQTAKDINAGVDNWVGFGDTADVYKLTMTNAGILTLGLTGLTGNANLSLLNSSGITLKTSSNLGTANESINHVALLSGTYYVKVAAGFGVNDAAYTMTNQISYFPGDDYDKAGNTIAAARIVDKPQEGTGWVGLGDSDDYYRFDFAAPALVTVHLYGMIGGNADLSVYDSKGKLLQKSANSGTLEDVITGYVEAGIYYARINAVSGNSIDYKLDFSKKDIVSGMLAS